MASSEKTSICLRSVINHILFELHVLKCWACGKSVEDATMRSKTLVWFEDATVVRRHYCGSKTLQWVEGATVVRRCYSGVEDPTVGRRPDFVRKTMQVHRRCTQLGPGKQSGKCLEEEL